MCLIFSVCMELRDKQQNLIKGVPSQGPPRKIHLEDIRKQINTPSKNDGMSRGKDYFKMETNHLPVLSNFRGYDMLVFRGVTQKLSCISVEPNILNPNNLCFVFCLLHWGTFFRFLAVVFGVSFDYLKVLFQPMNIHGFFLLPGH